MAVETELTFHAYGAAGAQRLMVLITTGESGAVDPHPEVTRSRDVRVVAVLLSDEAIDDPSAFGGATEGEQTASGVAQLIRDQLGGASTSSLTAGVVAYRDAGDVALRAVRELGATIDRLALVAVPLPESPLVRDDLSRLVGDIAVDTVILNGEHDPRASAAAATWYRDHLEKAHVEVVSDSDSLGLADVWEQVLAHLAPDSTR